MFPALRIPRPASGTRLMPCLLLLAVVLRALIPVGYMPDTAALRQGVIRISLCTSTGAVPMLQFLRNAPDAGSGAAEHGAHAGHAALAAEEGDAHAGHGGHGAHGGHQGEGHQDGGHSDSDHTAGAECPFWVSAHLTADLPPVGLAPVLAAVRDAAAGFLPPLTLPPLPPAGPPLGSRAPPSA